MDSIWKMTSNPGAHQSLTSDVKTDVLIIGGGITGILCAYVLKNAGVDCIIAESGKICEKTTANTTAKITLQHGLIYDKLIRRFGTEKASLYLKAQTDAINAYDSLCKDIDCDYKKENAFVYSTSDKRKLERELEAYNKLKCNVLFTDKPNIPIKTAGAIGVPNQSQFHPLKFISALSKNTTIYENTHVSEVGNEYALANGFKIRYKKIILATHFPFIDKHGLYFLKMFQHRSYVIALKNAGHFDGMYVDECKSGISFRSYNDILMLGGGAHRTGKSGGGWSEPENFAREHYRGAQIIAKWAAQDCITLDGIPYIGEYSKNTKNMYVATGFNKWGMTSAMISGMILRDMILGKQNEYSEVFSPSRTILRPQLAVNIAESLVGILKPTTPRCSHLGCALKYNRDEHSWDCSCHGSRFDESGKMLNNPANKNKCFNKRR